MKRFKAFWLRRSIAARLTVLLLCIGVGTTWFWLQDTWGRAVDKVTQQAYGQAVALNTALDETFARHGYGPSRIPAPGTDAYRELRFSLIFDCGVTGPYLLEYTADGQTVTAVSPLVLESAHGPQENITMIETDVSDFRENDLRAIDEHMRYTPAEWQGRSPYFTVYGTLYRERCLIPNRLVSCIDESTWYARTPVAEETSFRVYFQGLFADGADADRYFSALRYLMAWQAGASEDTLAALRTRDFYPLRTGGYAGADAYTMRSNQSMHGHEDFYTIYSAYSYDHAALTAQAMGVLPGASVLAWTVILCLFYCAVQHTVTAPLRETTAQTRQVSRLAFGKLSLDTARGDEIGDLNRALRGMADDLRARWDDERDLEDRRQQFVAAASHDLKTPLALIGGYAEAIAQDISPEENARYLAAIEQEIDRMNSLVREMLDYTKLDRTDELQAHRTVDVSALVNELLTAYAPLFQDRRLSTDIRSGVRFRADDTLLRRAFGCLLENAAQYSPAGGRVRVALDQKTGLRFTVENTCEPIPPDDLPRLFEMFYRGDKARGRSSHGLGLAITQKILSLHGLCCRAENTDAGVRFTVECA